MLPVDPRQRAGAAEHCRPQPHCWQRCWERPVPAAVSAAGTGLHAERDTAGRDNPPGPAGSEAAEAGQQRPAVNNPVSDRACIQRAATGQAGPASAPAPAADNHLQAVCNRRQPDTPRCPRRLRPHPQVLSLIHISTDDSLLKMLYPAMMDITKKWTGRRQDWSMIHAQLAVFFSDRMPD